MGVGRTSFVCVACRVSVKQAYPGSPEDAGARGCGRCGGALVHVGSAFAAPGRRDDEGWLVLGILLDAGIRFHKSCCGGPGYRPRTMAEVRERLTYAERSGVAVADALRMASVP